MSAPSHPLAYRSEIDGLRALAVVPVILFHAGFEFFSGGFVGVDVFFVISGFLITSILRKELDEGSFSIIGFYERRARRILPALFFMLAACIPFAWMWMTPDELNEFGKNMVAVTLFASNIMLWSSSGYFESTAEENPLLHTWSLGVEEQYYLIFPLFLLFTWRAGRQRQIWILAVIATASLLLSEWGWRNAPNANFYLTPYRAWELLLGSILAMSNYRTERQTHAEVFSMLGFVMILGSIIGFDASTPFPSLYAIVPTVGAVLILACADGRTVVGRALSTPRIVHIGLISYSAYLWHQPLLAYARLQSTERPSDATFVALCLATLLLAHFSWRFIEQPFRNRTRIRRRPVFATTFVGSALFLSAGISGAITDGFPERINARSRQLLQTAVSSPKRDECHTEGKNFTPPSEACTYFDENVAWAAFGDSHMVEPGFALAERLAAHHKGLIHLTFSGCGPSLLFESSLPGCTQWQTQALKHIANDSRIKNVLIGFRYSGALFGDHLADYPNIPNVSPSIQGLGPEESRQLIWDSFALMIETLHKAGKRVFVLAPIPELGHQIQQIIVSNQFRDGSTEWGTTQRTYYNERNKYILSKLASLPWGDQLIRIDPASTLCNSEICRALLDGEAAYFDDDHLSVAGARKVMAQMEHYLDE